MDLLVVRGSQRLGFALERSTTPVVTRSMRSAIQDLALRRLWVIHAGERTADLDRRVRAVPLSRVLRDLEPLA